MKKLLLIALVAGGLAFASAPRSDAQVYLLGLGSDIRATMGITRTDTTIRIAITGLGTMGTIGLIIGMAGIVTTVITDITTIGAKS